VTKRIAVIVLAGLAAVLATGGYALSMRGSTDTIRSLPHWGLYGDASWAKLQGAASAHKLVPASIEIVTGTSLERNRAPFAILRARTTSGRSCFAVATGVVIARLVCRVDSPVMLFTQRDTCAPCAPGGKAPLKTLSVLALVRGDVQAVVSLYGGRAANIERVSAGGGVSAFNAGARTGTTFRVLGRSNRVLSELHLRLARKSA
jgi:hypothetical protein